MNFTPSKVAAIYSQARARSGTGGSSSSGDFGPDGASILVDGFLLLFRRRRENDIFLNDILCFLAVNNTLLIKAKKTSMT